MPDRLLVIDTSTPDLSIALFERGALMDAVHERVWRGHAERLLPSIAALPDGGRANAIWVGCGPGSFTGIRIGLAAAKALAFAWSAPLRGFDSLALIGATARAQRSIAVDTPLGVATDGGHGDWFVSVGGLPGRTLSPQVAAQWLQSDIVAGSRSSDLVALRGFGRAIDADADARLALQLPDTAFMADATPIYGRAPDAVPAR